MIEKEPVDFPELDMEVYHNDLYNGEHRAKIVGIRKTEVELYCDMSGGTHGTYGASWYPLEGTLRNRKICEQVVKYGSCTLHNLHCRFPDCKPYV